MRSNEWKKYLIQDVGKVITGRTPAGTLDEYFGGKTLFVTPSDMKEQKYIKNTERTLSILGEDKVNNIIFECGIVVSCIGWQMGKAAIVRQKAATNQQINTIIVDNSIANIDFLYYVLKLKREEIFQLGITATRTPIVKKTLFEKIPFFAPNLIEQKKIASILSALDAKIELNNRINAELEAMAKTLYDYWFVQFDFPDQNGKPYKSSGGKMVYNPTLKREIPEGWEVGQLGDLLELHYGKSLKRSVRSGFGYPVVGSSGIIGYHSEYLIKAPSIVLGRKGTLGQITYLSENFFPIDTTYYVNPKINIGFSFLYYLLLSIDFKKMNTDSAVPGLNRDNALGYKILIPPLKLIQSFEKFSNTIFTKKAQKQNQQLTQLRDWLLPMLMNGQIKIKK
ncbi:restriction endonuclease subunit S [Candidatus Albibeggiatoa sp. nov. BB20]|uniref:restriction endonuclease subunit S n=1 Tax=Candidatus Albibeggiatoa sp. nov. BB20 TaxID=3162723 RepID=UPI00336573AB